MKALNYKGVHLSDGLWQKQFNENNQWLLGLDEDRLLRKFRDKAQIPSTADVYPGWYGRDGGTFGQYVSAMCKSYAITHDARFKNKALRLMNGWAETIGADGHPNYQGNNHCYPYDKLLTALLDADEYLGWADALPLAETITKWANATFDKSVIRDGVEGPALEATGMNEWWTLPEMQVRAYQRTGNELYKELALEWSYHYMWDKLASGQEDIGLRHAYSHANSLCSAAAMYALTNEQKYLDAAVGGYNHILTKHTYVTGGYGPAETLFGELGYLGDSVLEPDVLAKHSDFKPFWGGTPRDDVWGNCEISCCTWAVFKLTHYLLHFTGKAEYAHWAENMLINCLGGQPALTSSGEVLYYARYFVNGAIKSVVDRRMHSDGGQNKWQCCTGTFPQTTAEYHNILCYTQEDAIYVSQYMASVIDIDGVTIAIDTEYPRKGDISMTINPNTDKEFDLCLRVPPFAKGKGEQLFINGEPTALIYDDKGWLRIKHCWQCGDVVRLVLPFTLRFESVDEKHPDVRALLYGPLVLAGNEFLMLKGDVNHPEKWIVLENAEQLRFTTTPGHDALYDFTTDTFVPYMDIPQNQWYYVYNRVQHEL